MVFHYWKAENRRGVLATLLYLLLPVAGVVADFWLMLSLDHKAVMLGLTWLCLGAIYLLYLTGGLRRQPPELRLEETV